MLFSATEETNLEVEAISPPSQPPPQADYDMHVSEETLQKAEEEIYKTVPYGFSQKVFWSKNIFFQLFEFAKKGDVESLRKLIKSETERMKKMASKGEREQILFSKNIT